MGRSVRVLLDTHALLWWLAGDEQLPEAMRALIGDDETVVLVSAASAWEISTKVRIGKLPGAAELARGLPGALESQGFEPLSITVEDAQTAGALPGPHRDPFDRMIAAQANARSLPVVSRDTALDGFGVRRLW